MKIEPCSKTLHKLGALVPKMGWLAEAWAAGWLILWLVWRVVVAVPGIVLVCGGVLAVPLLGSQSGWAAEVPGPGEWPGPAGLLLGLGSVAVGHAAVLVYHRVRMRMASQPPTYSLGAALKQHLHRPEGLGLLALYLTVSWLWWLPTSYYDGAGGISWPRVGLQLVVVDLAQYAVHRLQHRWVAVYCASHKPHHATCDPVLLDAYAGSIPDTLLMVVCPLIVTSRLVTANLWTYVAFGSIYANQLVLIHSEYPHAWDPVLAKLGVGTAADHHVHHRDPRHNLGHLLMWWDRAAGTYR